MKQNIMLIITIIIMPMVSFSEPNNQTCYDYITDEWPNYRYTIEDVNGEVTVTDKRTGLMWKQCLEGMSGQDCNTGNYPAAFNWSQALMEPEVINSTVGFSGYNDWRVPNVEELRSLASYQCSDPAINSDVFPNTPSALEIFSSTPMLNIFSDKKAWFMNIGTGITTWINRDALLNLRLVRAGNYD